MIKIESPTLEQAYKDASIALECSVAQLVVEVIQVPSKGIFGMFKKNAIIVAAKKHNDTPQSYQKSEPFDTKKEIDTQQVKYEEQKTTAIPKNDKPHIINDTIVPQSFVSIQDEDYEYEEEPSSQETNAYDVIDSVEKEINNLFNLSCFNIDKIEVSAYDDKTLLIEFKGEDSALLIGKEGYRYKALSYMIFNWINSKYQLQLRLEIAEFLKNQEESMSKYLATVFESIDRDGRAQTKTLDGVLVQIALKELRERYPDKYVAIRSTRDGLKYIIVNEYHNQ